MGKDGSLGGPPKREWYGTLNFSSRAGCNDIEPARFFCSTRLLDRSSSSATQTEDKSSSDTAIFASSRSGCSWNPLYRGWEQVYRFNTSSRHCQHHAFLQRTNKPGNERHLHYGILLSEQSWMHITTAEPELLIWGLKVQNFLTKNDRSKWRVCHPLLEKQLGNLKLACLSCSRVSASARE